MAASANLPPGGPAQGGAGRGETDPATNARTLSSEVGFTLLFLVPRDHSARRVVQSAGRERLAKEFVGEGVWKVLRASTTSTAETGTSGLAAFAVLLASTRVLTPATCRCTPEGLDAERTKSLPPSCEATSDSPVEVLHRQREGTRSSLQLTRLP